MEVFPFHGTRPRLPWWPVLIIVSSLLATSGDSPAQPPAAMVETARFNEPCIIRNRLTGKYLDLAI